MTLVQEPLAVEQPSAESQPVGVRAAQILRQMFENICQAVEEIDGNKFEEKTWKRDESGIWVEGENADGNIYIDRSLRNSNVFEKVGTNYVAMHGQLPPGMSFQGGDAVPQASEPANGEQQGIPFFATSTSFVINPSNPKAPTAHVNYRYFQIGDGSQPGSWWFGGGGDLTPIYLFEEDAIHFHQVHKEACDKHNPELYPAYKKWCDEYFYLPHRQEHRGVGGIFFDFVQSPDPESVLSFVKTCSEAFIPAYIPIVKKRKDLEYTEQDKFWQKLRRGRYAEFILLNDRGTRFGLQTGLVHTQSVLNCMPGEAFWSYYDEPASDSPEAKLLAVLKNARDWLSSSEEKSEAPAAV